MNWRLSKVLMHHPAVTLNSSWKRIFQTAASRGASTFSQLFGKSGKLPSSAATSNQSWPTPPSSPLLSATKVSDRGTPEALFQECVDHLRTTQMHVDADVDTLPSPAIQKLTADEIEVTRRIFRRLDPNRSVVPSLEAPLPYADNDAQRPGRDRYHRTSDATQEEATPYAGSDVGLGSLGRGGSRSRYIDPYWDPFVKVEDLKKQIATEFNEYSRLVSVSESRRQRLLIRRSLREHYRLYDPYSKSNARYYGRPEASRPYPEPHRLHERYWDPAPERRRLLYNNNRMITWRDTHILHNFVSDSGMLLPRRVTFATRRQQRAIVAAVKTARKMALFPLDCRPTANQLMPVMDPLQYLCDELSHRYRTEGDCRAKAMVQTMMQMYPKLNFYRFLRYEAERNKAAQEKSQQDEEERRGDFSRILRRYKASAQQTEYT